MSDSAFDELFGEVKGYDPSSEYPKKKLTPDGKSFKFFLALFLSIIVLCLTLITSVIYYEFFSPPEPEVLGEKSVEPKLQGFNYALTLDTQLDRFVDNFRNNIYAVEGSGAFGYIYGDSQDGTISLEGKTYFENGRIVYFDTPENYKVFWSDYDKKFVLLEDTKEYFFVTESTDFYYRNYIGQHILQDFLDDYLRNKDFIKQTSENVWEWEWFFYTPKNEFNKYSIRADVIFDNSTDYISKIKLFNNQGDEICSFEFSFVPIDSIEKGRIFDGYERIDVIEANSLL